MQMGPTRIGERPSTGVADGDFSIGLLAVIDASRNSGGKFHVPYLLSATADQVPYAVLGAPDDNPTGKLDVLIVQGIVPVQIKAAFDKATMMGKSLVTADVKGQGKVATAGLGIIVDGGTHKFLNLKTGVESTKNVVWLDLGK